MRRHPVCACLMTDADYPANFKSCDRWQKHWLPAFLPSIGLIRFRAIPDPRGSKILRTGEPDSAGAKAAPYKPIPLAATISKAFLTPTSSAKSEAPERKLTAAKRLVLEMAGAHLLCPLSGAISIFLDERTCSGVVAPSSAFVQRVVYPTTSFGL